MGGAVGAGGIAAGDAVTGAGAAVIGAGVVAIGAGVVAIGAGVVGTGAGVVGTGAAVTGEVSCFRRGTIAQKETAPARGELRPGFYQMRCRGLAGIGTLR